MYKIEKKYYQLVATGICFLGRHSIYSKQIYKSREIAEKHIAGFRLVCTMPKSKQDLYYLDPEEPSVVDILELELIMGE